MPDKIIRANREVRRRLVIALAAVTIAGLLALALTQIYLRSLESLSQADPMQAIDKLIVFIYICGVALAVGTLATSAYLAWAGIRVVRQDQFPWQGMWVIKDTRIVRGDKAKLRGYALCGGALIVLATGVAVSVVGGEIVSALTELSQQAR